MTAYGVFIFFIGFSVGSGTAFYILESVTNDYVKELEERLGRYENLDSVGADL